MLSTTLPSVSLVDNNISSSVSSTLTPLTSQLIRKRRQLKEVLQDDYEIPERPSNLLDDMMYLLGASDYYNSDMRMMTDFLTLPLHLREAVGANFNELIMECTFLGVQCNDARLFRKVISPQYGTCYSFNSNITQSWDAKAGKRTTGLTGEMNGLNLLLYVKHYAYPPTLTATKGARVSIHPSDISPDVEDSGLNVMPNAATSFAIEQMTIKRLREPYQAQCVSKWTEVKFFPLSPGTSQVSNEKYNGVVCKKLCLQHQFYSSCGCFHPLFPSMEMFASRHFSTYNTSIRPCLLDINGKDYNCTSDIQWKYDQQNISCFCPPSCYEMAYNVFPSMTSWPRHSYVAVAAKRMGIDVSGLSHSDLDELASNILEVKIFFKTLNTARLEQSPYISDNSLMSALGGAMSLYLGISIIMLAEVLEFSLTLCWTVLLVAVGRYKETTTVGPSGQSEPVSIAVPPSSAVGSAQDATLKPVYLTPPLHQ